MRQQLLLAVLLSVAPAACRTDGSDSTAKDADVAAGAGATSAAGVTVTPAPTGDCDDRPLCAPSPARSGVTCTATDATGAFVAKGQGGTACHASKSLESKICQAALRPSDLAISCQADPGGVQAHIELAVTPASLASGDPRLNQPPPLYPNKVLTPGKVNPAATTAKVCTPGYTATVRNVTDAEKKAIFARYQIPAVPGAYEIDHFISLELGGSNDPENLWPQPYAPTPGAREKDVVETDLHRRICSGAITIEQGQSIITTDWYAEYKRLNPGR